MSMMMRLMFEDKLLRAPEGVEGGGADAGASGDEGAAPAAGESTGVNSPPEDSPASALSSAGEADGEAAEAGDAGEAAGEAFDASALTLPEGFELPEGVGDKLSEILSSDMSAQERGQALADLHTSMFTEAREAANAAAAEAWTNLNNEWMGAVRELPEFKNNIEAELGGVKQALVALGAGEDFFAAMDLTGAGNNPHVLQMLHKLTAPHREGAAVGGGATQSRGPSSAEKMYPTMRAQG